MLKHYIAGKFDLEKKGQKLIDAGFALFGVTIGVSILQMATLLACGSQLHLWWKAMLPWFPIFCWASWRYLLRYLHTEAFVCDHCGRLKCLKVKSEKYFGKTKVCLRCEKRSEGFRQSIDEVKRKADLLLRDVEFAVKHSGEQK